MRYSDVKCFKASPPQIVHSTVGERNVIFLDLRDDFDSVLTLKLDGDDKVEPRSEQLRNQHGVSD